MNSSYLENQKIFDLESLTIIQKRLIELGLEDSRIMVNYVKIIELKSKLLSLEFSKLSKMFSAYRSISDSLISNVVKGLDTDSPINALKAITESLIDYSNDVEKSLIDNGYDETILDSIRILQSRVEFFENAQNTKVI